MNYKFLLEQIEKYTDVYIVDVIETVDTSIAKSHFFDIHFNKDNINIVDSYTHHGIRLKQYMTENLPMTIEYDCLDFYQKLLDTINELDTKCRFCEFKDEENFT